MKVRRCFFILMFFALCGVGVYAQQPPMGELIYDDESGCFFRVISLSPGRVAVVHPPAGISSFAHYSGVVRVPDTVWYTSSRPLQVYAVADSAFFNCSSLTKVELPATLRTIGVDAFSGTSSLDTIRCYGEIPPEMYYDAINLRSSMGNLTRGDDFTRYKDVIVLRVPCSGLDNYTSVQGWARFSNTTGESMFMLYKDTICEGQNYNNHQFSLTKPSSGTYQKINIPGGRGCTYDAELHLVVHPVYENVYVYYFCNDSSLSYNANGFHINDWTGGAYAWTQALLSVHGCDSISHLEFRRLMGEMDFYDEVCMGAPYLRIFNETLLFELLAWETDTPDFDTVITKNFEPENDTMTAYQERCLQTIKTHIHVNPILRDTLVANSCEGYPYTWTRTGYNASRVSITHSDTYSVSGFYCDTMFSNKGCLMYKNLDLYVWPPNDTVLYDTICGNECLLFGNSYVRTEGVLTAKYANQHLCDSNVALHLTVRNSYSDGQSGYTRVPIYHSDFNQSEDRFAWKFANGYNGWRVKNGYLRVSSGESTNNYNLNQQSDSYAYLTYNTGDYDSIWIEMPIVVGGESYMDYFRVLLPGTASSTSLFNTNSVYRVGYKNTRHNQTDTLTLHWHNNANGRGNQAAVIVNELTVTGVSHQLRNHAPVGIVANICQGDVFNKNGHSYNTTGVYPIDYFTVGYGCDSLVQLNLTVHEHSDSSFVKEMCDGGSFVFDGVRYTQTTTVTNNYEDRWGCDSIRRLDLTVWPTPITEIDTVHLGDNPLYFGGRSITEDGSYTFHYSTSHGCDSTVILNVTIHHNQTTTISASICDGETYSDNGFNESAPGRYTRHVQAVTGADSTIILNLTVNPVYDDTLDITICDRQTYLFGGRSYGVAGYYTDSLHTYRGCDSVVTLHLNVNPVFDTVVYDTVRGDEGYWFYGVRYDSTGIYRDTLPNRYGCDSITELHLQIYNTATTHLYDTICDRNVYEGYGFSGQTVTGTYRRDLQTFAGADSTVYLHLCVNSVYDDTLDITICDRQTYHFGGRSYGVAGYYTDSLHTYRGCDSVVTLHLNVNPVFDTVVYDTVRGDEGYWFYDVHYDSTGIYRDTLPNRYGCDSITELHLQIYNTATTHLYDTICDRNVYEGYGFSGQTVTGTYRRDLQTFAGADSTVYLHLCVNSVYDDTLDITICDRQTYLFGGRSYGVAGYYTDSLHTYRGCDSVVTLHLNVNPVFDTVVYDTVRGDEGYWFYDVHYDSTGIYRDTLPNRYGCDSITELHLQIYNTATTHLYDTICDRDVYEGYGFSGQTVTGTYRLNLQTFAGADSTVYLHLWVNPVYDDTLDITICDRQTYLFGGRSYGVAGYYTDSLHTYKGCDSVVTLHLIVNPVYEVDVYDTVRGDDGYWFFGTHLDTTGVYCDTLPTQQGCDSIIFLHLQIYNTATTHLYDTICDRDVYEGYGFSGLTTVGIYVDSLLTYGGADSLVYLHLWVNPVYEVDVYDTICSNRFLIHHGDTLRRAGDYTDTLPSVLGCDSIITMHLFVKESYSDTFYAEICQGGSYFFHIEEPLTEEGLYRFYMHGINGCDSIETLLLTVHPIYNYTIEDSILPTENYVFGNRIIYDPGFYSDTLSSQFGCDSIVNLQLRNWYLHTTRLRDTICDGDSVFFNNQWCKRDSVYTDTLLADDGADSLVVLFLKVSPVYNDTLFDSIFCTEFYLFGDDTIRLEGLYTHHLLTERGCDSTVTLNLYVHTVRDIDSVVCMDRLPFIWNGITFPDTLVTSPIVYKDTAIVWNDTAGRNIMLAMRVTVVPNPIQTIADTIVENQLPYSFRGYVYEGNVESDTLLLPATVGCDTTTYYSLFYYPNVAATADTTVCYGQLPLEWNGVTFQVPEGVLSITQTATLRAHTGADSVLTMNVNVLQNTYTTRHDTIVENLLPYEVHGHIYFGACNLDTLVIPNSVGCDSVIYFRLLVNGNGVTMLDTTLCDDLLPINWNGHNFDDDGSTDLLSDTTIYHNQLGADSMVIMRVHILRCSSQVFDSTVCSAQLPLRWNGRTFNLPQDMPTTLVDTIHLYTPSGADSLIILRLRVNESFDQTFYDTICANHPYSFLGEQYASDCILNASLQSHFGCDSSVVVHLKVWPTETSSFEDIICPNTVYRWIDGNAYTEPVLGPFTTLRTVHGCDSTVYLHLIEGEPAVADIWSDKTWVKVDEPMVRLVDHTLHGDSRVWQFPDSVSTYEELDYTYPSDYDSVRIYLIATNHDGCVDTASLLLRLDRDFIWVPNVFTPALNENNHFQVFGQGLTDVKVSIYTGTGLFIYSWEGMDGYWDGTHDGKLCPQAAYTYKVTYATERNPRGYNTQVGTVVLLR